VLRHRVPEVVGVGEEHRTMHAHDQDARDQFGLEMMAYMHVRI
jgi:hypothetical protein